MTGIKYRDVVSYLERNVCLVSCYRTTLPQASMAHVCKNTSRLLVEVLGPRRGLVLALVLKLLTLFQSVVHGVGLVLSRSIHLGRKRLSTKAVSDR